MFLDIPLCEPDQKFVDSPSNIRFFCNMSREIKTSRAPLVFTRAGLLCFACSHTTLPFEAMVEARTVSALYCSCVTVVRVFVVATLTSVVVDDPSLCDGCNFISGRGAVRSLSDSVKEVRRNHLEDASSKQ